MGFHYGYEKRKFDAEWTRLEQEYRAAGMDDRQIAAMKEYDWTWFCSQRTYQNRVQALPSEQCEDESEQSCLFRKFESLSCTWDTGDVDSRRFGWLSSLEDELLYRRLCKLPEDDLELLTLLIVDGYRQADVARLWNCSRSAITQRIGQKKRLTASAARRKHSVTAAIFDCCTLICRIGEKLAVYPSQMPRVLMNAL